MAAPHRRSTASIDRSLSRPLSMSDDDSDIEFAGIVDGFRPVDAVASQPRPPSTTQHHRDFSHHRRTPPPRPSSATKPNRSSLTLRHDGTMGPVAFRLPTVSASASSVSPASSTSNPSPTRSSSVSTDGPFMRAESPYQGPTGPSHPYQIYAQEAQLSRTTSAATSTIRVPERSYQGPSGPTHPYGMYPQNTAPEADAGSIQAAPVVVGFPGRSQEYHRRLGPEGEEVADIIGPDGHTEQLPPYTKYPDEAIARKTNAALPALATSGAGGIGLATRDPEFASREDLHAPPSRRSSGSAMTDSNNHINAGDVTPSEKPRLNNWQRVARRRLCGIVPIWAVCLVGVTVLAVLVIMLPVLFTFLHRHPPPKDHSSDDESDSRYVTPTPVSVTMTTTFDASPFTTTPTSILPLPTGAFGLSLSSPSLALSSCLDASQNQAWSCRMSPDFPYQMKVDSIGGSGPSSANEISLEPGESSVPLLYGLQAPMTHNPRLMTLAQDNSDTKWGPAWFFQTLYDKLVILPESALPNSAANSKRAIDWDDRSTYPEFVRKSFPSSEDGPTPGDRPWFCYWNNTLLETFIYVNDTSIAGAQTSSSPTASTSQATATPAYLPSYSKVVKIQERRITSKHGVGTPYCVQHSMANDGTTKPYTAGMDHPVTVYLNETEASTVQPLVARSALEAYGAVLGERGEYDRLSKEQTPDVSCGCVWVAD